MKSFRRNFAILIVAICLRPSSALPDFLAPFRSMFTKSGSPIPSSSPFPNSKPLSSQKDPSSSSHGFKNFGPHGPPQESSNPFNSDFGFGSPPSSSSGGGGGSSHVRPGRQTYGGGSPFSSSNQGFRSGPSSFSGRPSSSSSSSGFSSRPVRQQSGGGYRPSFSSSSFGRPGSSPFGSQGAPQQQNDHRPRPQGPPNNFRGPGHDDSSPYKYQGGGGGGDDGPSSFPEGPSPFQGGYQGGPPPSSGSFSSSPYQGGPPRGYNGGPPPSSDGPGEEGPGFSGFGSFPGEEDDSPPPRGGGGGGPGFGPESSSDSSKPFIASSPSSSRFPQPGGPPSASSFGSPSGQDDGPQSYFGGGDYPEQYESNPRGTRQPQVISANDVSKYPPQINEDDEQGPPQGFGFGGGNGRRHKHRREPPPSSSSSPQSQSSSPPWASHGPEDGPSEMEESPNAPAYQPRPRYPSSSSGKGFPSYPRPVGPSSSGGYQASSDSVQYGKPMIMSSSAPTKTVKVIRRGQRQKKRYSAKIAAPQQNHEVQSQNVPLLSSPQDPNYRPMASSINSVAAPFEPDTAASGHGQGGYEGLSPNGDRILYHVGGHQGPHSYRFGYDTGKGYNRLFRFEEKDGKGYVKGKYGFYDKQGKLQVVNYEAHPKHGFHAERGH